MNVYPMGVKHLIHLVATSAIGATWRWMWIGAGSTSMVGAPGGERIRLGLVNLIWGFFHHTDGDMLTMTGVGI